MELLQICTINDAEIVSVVFPFQLFYTFFVFFCTGDQICPMPFGAPESKTHSTMYSREVAIFSKKFLKSDQIICPTSWYLVSRFFKN